MNLKLSRWLIFDVLVCCDDVNSPKSSSEPMLKAMHEMNCDKEEVIIVGDGYNDILSAKNAGMKSILSTWYGDMSVKKDSDYVAESVYELRQILLPILTDYMERKMDNV